SGRLPIARGEAGLEAVVRNTLGDTHTTPLSPRLTLDAEPEEIPAAVRMHAARGRFPLRHCCPRRTSLADAARTALCGRGNDLRAVVALQVETQQVSTTPGNARAEPS